MLNFYNKISKKWLLIAGFLILVFLSIFLYSVFVNSQQKNPDPYAAVNMPKGSVKPGRDYVAGQISVSFKKDIAQSAIDAKLQEYNASITSTNKDIGVSLIKVPQGKEMEVMQNLSKDGLIEFAEYDYIREKRFTPNDPSYGQQWHLKKIQADKAWDVTKGAGIKIAVVDTGVDVNHPDLKSKMAATNGSVTDSEGHGTHVAGIMAAATNNAVGIASVCPECKILASKDDGGSDSGAAAAITWAANQGAKAINMSWGGSQNSSTLKKAIDYAFSKGALPVAAVQNENINDSNDYPSSWPNVMSVTNSTTSDTKFGSAGYGKWVWIASPGTNIYSTTPGGKYENMTGTSMATPVIVGVVGLVASTPYGKTPTAVRQRICDTSDKISGTGTQFKCGRVNAFKAVGGGSPTPTKPVGGGVPSPNCLGACPTPSPTKAPVPTTPIGGVDPTDEVEPTGAEPTDPIGPEPTMDPCEEEQLNQRHHKGGKKDGNKGLLSQLVEFFKILFQMIQQLLGLSPSQPPSPAPDPGPGPEPTGDPCDTSPAEEERTQPTDDMEKTDDMEPTDDMQPIDETTTTEPEPSVAMQTQQTTDPCVQQQFEDRHHKHGKDKNNGLLKMLLELFVMIFQLLQHGAPAPQPAPAPDPIPVPEDPC